MQMAVTDSVEADFFFIPQNSIIFQFKNTSQSKTVKNQFHHELKIANRKRRPFKLWLPKMNIHKYSVSQQF